MSRVFAECAVLRALGAATLMQDVCQAASLTDGAKEALTSTYQVSD